MDPQAGWSIAEDLTPEGAEFLEALTREVEKHFSKKGHRQEYGRDSSEGVDPQA